MIQKRRNSETVEEFVADSVPVQQIIWGRESFHTIAREQNIPSHGPVTLLDITNHPLVNITDLSRVFKTDMQDGEGPTEYAWDYWVKPGNFLVRLILNYTSPVRVEFAIVWRCSDPEHWAFLRWVTENEGMVVLADEYAGPIPAEFDESPRNMLLIETDVAEQLGEFLCHASIVGAEQLKGQTLTGLEVVMAALEAKRFISFEDIAAQAVAVLGMNVLGRDSVILKTLQGHQSVPYTGISQPFQMLLQQVSRQRNVGVAMLDGVSHMIRLDWARETGQL